MTLIPPASLETFAAHYPETPHTFRHGLSGHPLFTRDALAELVETLPASSVEHLRADLPKGQSGVPARHDTSVADTIRTIDHKGSWVVIRNIEQSAPYAAVLHGLLDELRPLVEAKTGPMLTIQGFIFVTSPGGVSSFHFDPEHNVLLQLEGHKEMTQYPTLDTAYAADESHEAYHVGGSRDLPWREACEQGGTRFAIGAGDALFVPVMAPHIVTNGDTPTVALSITWRSEWSYAEADARAFNSVLRRIGLRPAAPRRWPSRNLAKAIGWRMLRKLRAG
jgi:hypothetical protein